MTDLAVLWRARFCEEPPDSIQGLHSETLDLAERKLEGFLSRRSQRSFTKDPIEPGLLDLLLASAFSGPTKSDLQQCSVVIVDDPEKRAQMQTWTTFDGWIGKAPIFLIFCGDIRRQRRISQRHKMPHENDNLDTFMNTAVDAAIVLASFVAAAEAIGLGCCPVSMVRNHLQEARALFSLPDGVYPIAGLAVGYVDKASDVSLRLPLRVTTHRNTYDDADLCKELEEYDQRRHELCPINALRQRHTDRYGVKPGLMWSENTARQMSVPERAEFSDLLRRWGFSLK